MLIKHFIVILCIFRVSYGGDSNNNETLQYILDQLPQSEGTTCEDKISAFLSLIKSNGIFCNISESNMLKQSYDLQKNLHGTSYKLHKDVMVSKLEEEIEIKLNKNIPDKIDVTIINHILYALNILQTDIEERISLETKTLPIDNTLEKVNAETKTTLLELQNDTISSKLDALNAKVTNLENSIMNLKLDTIEKQLKKLETLTNTLNDNLDKMQKKPGSEQNARPDAAENTTSRNTLVNRTRGYWDCKKRTVTGHDFSPVRMDSLDYALLESDDHGLTYYETSFAAMGKYVIIQFASLPHAKKGDSFFYICLYEKGINFFLASHDTDSGNRYTTKKNIQSLQIPNTISLNEYTVFGIKIKKQTIELYKMGNDIPILKYTDNRFRAVQYIGFTSWIAQPATILYDCPPHFEETLFKCCCSHQ